MSWAESQATKDGCNTLPELEIGSLAHDGVEEFVMFPPSPLSSIDLISLKCYLAQMHHSCRVKVVHLITGFSVVPTRLTYTKTI